MDKKEVINKLISFRANAKGAYDRSKALERTARADKLYKAAREHKEYADYSFGKMCGYLDAIGILDPENWKSYL